MTKSELFTQFNKARTAARAGKLDPKRVNKALGVAQLKTIRPYHTTINSCDCPDQLYRPNVICAHRIAAMIEYRATHASQPQIPPEPEQESPLMNSNGDWIVAEQLAVSYFVHVFYYQADWMEYKNAHPNITWVRPSHATGRRQRPDEVHPIGG